MYVYYYSCSQDINIKYSGPPGHNSSCWLVCLRNYEEGARNREGLQLEKRKDLLPGIAYICSRSFTWANQMVRTIFVCLWRPTTMKDFLLFLFRESEGKRTTHDGRKQGIVLMNKALLRLIFASNSLRPLLIYDCMNISFVLRQRVVFLLYCSTVHNIFIERLCV